MSETVKVHLKFFLLPTFRFTNFITSLGPLASMMLATIVPWFALSTLKSSSEGIWPETRNSLFRMILFLPETPLTRDEAVLHANVWLIKSLGNPTLCPEIWLSLVYQDKTNVMCKSSQSQVQVKSKSAWPCIESSQVQDRSLKKLTKSSQVQVHLPKNLIKSSPSPSPMWKRHFQVQVKSTYIKVRFSLGLITPNM